MNFDLLSFILGLGAGFLFWVISRLIKRTIPTITTFVSKQLHTWKDRKSSGIEKKILGNALERAQNNHLAGSLFTLHQILIPPKIIPPPKSTLNNKNSLTESLIDRLIPHIPDHPELISQLPVNNISVAEAIQNGVNCFIIGSAGSGKTCALAHLVSILAREYEDESYSEKTIPVYLHANDLSMGIFEEQPPHSILSEAIRGYIPSIKKERLLEYFGETLGEKKIILILDGLDEISPQKHGDYTHFLQRCLDHIPDIQIITTSTQDYFGELIDLQFSPYVLAYWNQIDTKQFVQKWNKVWSEIKSERSSQHQDQNLNHLSTAWLQLHHKIRSPLEWTLLLWASNSGDLNGPTTWHAIDAYITRLTRNAVPRSALEKIAYTMIRDGEACLSYTQIETILAKHHLQDISREYPKLTDMEELSGNLSEIKKSNKDHKIAFRSRVISYLIRVGFFIEHHQGLISFNNPVLAGYLASRYPETQIEPFSELDLWSEKLEMLRFLSTQEDRSSFILDMVMLEQGSQNRNLLLVSRWLNTPHRKQTWRTILLEKMSRLLVSAKTSRAMKIKIITAFIMSGEPTIDKLLNQLLSMPDAEIRFVASLGHIIIPSVKSNSRLLKLLNDDNRDVQLGSVLALSLRDHPNAESFCEDILGSGTEEQRIIAAEVMSQSGESGKIKLLELLESNDLLTRRAAIAGLAKITDDTVLDEIEKTMQRDAQWVIRNYAAKVVEAAKKPVHLFAAEKLPEISEAPWLISYAGKLGIGISPGILPIEILIHCIQNGEPEVRIGAMEYLRSIDDPNIGALYSTVFENEGSPVKEFAELNLFYFSRK